MSAYAEVEHLAPSRAVRADIPVVHQLVFAVLFAVATVSVVYSDVAVVHPVLVLNAAMAGTVALVASAAVPWDSLGSGWQLPLPLANVLMVGMLEASTAFVASYLVTLVFLPIVSMAWIDLWRGALVGVLSATATVVLPVVVMPEVPVPDAALSRAVVVPLVALALGAFVALVARAQRLRAGLVDERTAQLERSRDVIAGLIDAATEQAIIATDSHGRIELFSQGAEKMTGESAAAMIGRSAMDLRVVTDLDEMVAARGLDTSGLSLDEARWQVLLGEAASGGVETHDVTLLRGGEPAGTVRVTITQRAPAPSELEGGYLFVSTDITQQVETERAQHQFIGYVSHELRTPISSVLGYVDLLELDADDLSDTQRGYLEVIRRNGRRQLRLVEDLLLTAQVDAGRFSVRPEPVDLGGVVAGAVRTAAPQAESAGVELADTTSGPVPLDGDPMRLGQLVDNLLSNALKFTPSGGRVTVHAELQARPNDVPGDRAEPTGPSPAAVLTVRDTGVGIPGDELRHLTDRFYRASSATVRRIPGAGLGLAITQAIVDAHGGTLSITSAVGSGTTFTVVLPVTPPGGRAE